jgi:hypothetical protein
MLELVIPALQSGYWSSFQNRAATICRHSRIAERILESSNVPHAWIPDAPSAVWNDGASAFGGLE